MTVDERSLRVLIVDGHADTRSMYAELLNVERFAIEEAEDGRQALARALTTPPDVIVTETRLAGISGLDLCRELRADHQTPYVPIVFVTADAFPASLQRARDAGADAVLVKPCPPDRLIEEIRAALGKGAALKDRMAVLHEKAQVLRNQSDNLLARSAAHARRETRLTKSHERFTTTTPPSPPPTLHCPRCDQWLTYVESHIGGVSVKQPEQWDDFECPSGCGRFQYRQRTRKLRSV